MDDQVTRAATESSSGVGGGSAVLEAFVRRRRAWTEALFSLKVAGSLRRLRRMFAGLGKMWGGAEPFEDTQQRKKENRQGVWMRKKGRRGKRKRQLGF